MDVELAEVQFNVNQTAIVTCYFAEGSQALGCYVLLSFFSGNQSFNISRPNRKKEVAILFPVHCNLSEISVYDWEANGTIGALLISMETSFSASNESCGMVAGTTATLQKIFSQYNHF